ncbi:GNAT family N-acetyltransferase [Pseudoalteromonas xiamenensis]
MNLTFTPVKSDDEPYLLALRKATMTAHLEAMGKSPSDDDHMMRIWYCFEHAELILNGKNDVIGMVKSFVDGHTLEIIQLQISPHFQNQGFGRSVIEKLLEDSKILEVQLSVLKRNPARALYERLGFVIEHEGEDEYFMRLKR